MSSAAVRDEEGARGATADLRIAGVARGRRVGFRFDGRAVAGYEGESLACALACAGIRVLRSSARNGEPRGMFCHMGSCQECVVRVDGRTVPACQEPVREGLDVRSGTIEDGA